MNLEGVDCTWLTNNFSVSMAGVTAMFLMYVPQTPIIMDPKLHERVLNESREEVNQTKLLELDKLNACQ